MKQLMLACVIGSVVVATAGAQTRPPVARPTAGVSAVERSWRSHLRAGAIAEPKKHFRNLTAEAFGVRLRVASKRYRFTVVRLSVLHPRQAAPLVIVETADPQAFVSSVPAILRLLDPKAPTADDRAGWAYEGFFFEARDLHGVPFLATFNWWRGPHAGGGQWASDPSLFPFLHG